MTTKIETISLALMLRPSRCIQRGRNRAPQCLRDAVELSVSSMGRHRNFCAARFRFAECREMRLLLGEDRQVARRKAEDGKPERDEHRGDHHFGPLRRVAAAHRIFHSGDGHVQTIGYEAQQGQHGSQVKPLRAFANLREPAASPSGAITERNISSRKKRCS